MDSNFYTGEKNETHERFIKEFERARFNAVYFLEMFWNKVNPDNKIELSDEDKQALFDKYRGAPFFIYFYQLRKHSEWQKEMKEKGYKDWEIQ